jgi:hypothetical protein
MLVPKRPPRAVLYVRQYVRGKQAMTAGHLRFRFQPVYPALQLALNANGDDDRWQQQREEEAGNSGKP